jgi:ketosteroid isomerase-like protein
MASHRHLVTQYLDAFASVDFKTTRGLLHEDFSFAGPIDQVEGRDAFLEGATRLIPLMNGCRVLNQWEDGNDVCSIYDFRLRTPVATGAVVMAEWNRIREGRIASSKLIFDTAAFLALLPQAPAA